MIEQYTDEILNAVKELLADETKSLESLKELIKEKLKESYELGSEHQEAVDRLNDN